MRLCVLLLLLAPHARGWTSARAAHRARRAFVQRLAEADAEDAPKKPRLKFSEREDGYWSDRPRPASAPDDFDLVEGGLAEANDIASRLLGFGWYQLTSWARVRGGPQAVAAALALYVLLYSTGRFGSAGQPAPEELDAPGWSGVTDPASYYPAEPVRERQAPPRSRATGTGPPPPGLDR